MRRSDAYPRYKSAPGDGREPIPVGTDVFAPGAVFSPVMLLRQSALATNVASMARYCRDRRVELAMHGKTSMSPELTAAQLRAGAWGVSAATPSQVRTFRAFGVRNVLLANELVDPGGIRWIAEYQREHPDDEFLCYVDSLRGVAVLQETLSRTPDVTLDVLLEVAPYGGRTGARSIEAAVSIAEAVRGAPRLRLVGISGYEGAVAGDRDVDSVEQVRHYAAFVADAARELDGRGLFDTDRVVLSLGGGAFFDIVVDVLEHASLPTSEPRIIIRAGSYITHDDGLYTRIAAFAQPASSYRLEPALELWGRVLSRPEPTLAFLDFGRRDTSFDQGLPVPKWARDADGTGKRQVEEFAITALNDQHAYLQLPASDALQPGDWVGCGVSHPCTAFDKWRYIPVIDDEDQVVDSVTTFF